MYGLYVYINMSKLVVLVVVVMVVVVRAILCTICVDRAGPIGSVTALVRRQWWIVSFILGRFGRWGRIAHLGL